MVPREGSVENLVVQPGFWKNRRVLVTGHTGFKGSWLALWLAELGAQVSGFAQAPNTEPSLFELLGLDRIVPSTFADINDRAALDAHLEAHKPEVVLHMAAQSLVRFSYDRPVETFATNVMGTVNLLDAVRAQAGIRAVVVVTSDKCYENNEWPWGYRENEPMGGHDPYSASKGCTELAATAMRRSFFHGGSRGHSARVATARAGNVIGGGDWSADRLVPDIIRGAVHLRSPHAVRPWQHVLEPLSGYLRLAERLFSGTPGFDEGWNFGPAPGGERQVIEVAHEIVAALGVGRIVVENTMPVLHEANLLKLDIAKVQQKLRWTPTLTFDKTVEMTASWYSAWRRGGDVVALTRRQIEEYIVLANETRAAAAPRHLQEAAQ